MLNNIKLSGNFKTISLNNAVTLIGQFTTVLQASFWT